MKVEADIDKAGSRICKRCPFIIAAQKEYHKLCEKYNEAVLDPSHIFELLNVVFYEFVSDNWEIILKQLHLPTINFRVLKQIADVKTKQVIGIE